MSANALPNYHVHDSWRGEMSRCAIWKYKYKDKGEDCKQNCVKIFFKVIIYFILKVAAFIIGSDFKEFTNTYLYKNDQSRNNNKQQSDQSSFSENDIEDIPLSYINEQQSDQSSFSENDIEDTPLPYINEQQGDQSSFSENDIEKALNNNIHLKIMLIVIEKINKKNEFFKSIKDGFDDLDSISEDLKILIGDKDPQDSCDGIDVPSMYLSSIYNKASEYCGEIDVKPLEIYIKSKKIETNTITIDTIEKSNEEIQERKKYKSEQYKEISKVYENLVKMYNSPEKEKQDQRSLDEIKMDAYQKLFTLKQSYPSLEIIIPFPPVLLYYSPDKPSMPPESFFPCSKFKPKPIKNSKIKKGPPLINRIELKVNTE